LALPLQPIRLERDDDKQQCQQYGYRLGKQQPKTSKHLKS